jgi:hypothetical protein
MNSELAKYIKKTGKMMAAEEAGEEFRSPPKRPIPMLSSQR